jgi:methenyltetrahydromethanopterin cyclohydrolase
LSTSTTLNDRAAKLFDAVVAEAAALGVIVHRDGSATIVDFGIAAPGSVEAGRRLAEICLAGLGTVAVGEPIAAVGPWSTISVRTTSPLAACLYSQYAGWQLAGGKFFAMGSGPMRAAAAREPLFAEFGFQEKSATVVGVLETRKLPPKEIVTEIAQRCGVAPDGVRLCVAPTASLAGTLQVVARSVETALHKLHELKFDVRRVVSGTGTAPLPPVAKDDLAAIGWTNDAVLYGGDVVLEVRGDDASLEAVGPHVPACASPDYGRPFAEIFERYNRDFYKIDPHLFSPALVTFVNLDTGRTFRYGEINPDVLRRSFES